MVNSRTIFTVGCLDAVLYVRKRSAFMHARDMHASRHMLCESGFWLRVAELHPHSVFKSMAVVYRTLHEYILFKLALGRKGYVNNILELFQVHDQTLSGGNVQSLQRKKWMPPNGKNGCSLRRKLSWSPLWGVWGHMLHSEGDLANVYVLGTSPIPQCLW